MRSGLRSRPPPPSTFPLWTRQMRRNPYLYRHQVSINLGMGTALRWPAMDISLVVLWGTKSTRLKTHKPTPGTSSHSHIKSPSQSEGQSENMIVFWRCFANGSWIIKSVGETRSHYMRALTYFVRSCCEPPHAACIDTSVLPTSSETLSKVLPALLLQRCLWKIYDRLG